MIRFSHFGGDHDDDEEEDVHLCITIDHMSLRISPIQAGWYRSPRIFIEHNVDIQREAHVASATQISSWRHSLVCWKRIVDLVSTMNE